MSVARRGERVLVVEQTEAERRQREDALARADVGAAHLEVALQPHLGKDRRQVVGPIGDGRALARQRGEPAFEQVAEARAGDVVIDLAALDEIERHVERVVDVALEAHARREGESEHAGARRVGVAPDFRAGGEKAVERAVGERRIGEQRGDRRLQRQADPELGDHVGFVGEIEIGLRRRGAEHHVEAARPDLGHVARHDAVAALRHDRRFGERPFRTEAQREEADPERLADRVHAGQMRVEFGGDGVDGRLRRAGQFELAARLERDRAAALPGRKGRSARPRPRSAPSRGAPWRLRAGP